MRVIFLGPPNAGKGTIAEMLNAKHKIPKLSTGDLFREHIKNKTALGIEANKYISKGYLVPDNLTIEMVKEKISNMKNIILDGFPRTIAQAQALDKIIKIDKVVNFTAKQKTLLFRASGRLTCPLCHKIYHVTNIPPKKPGYCDKDNSKLVQREDDKLEKAKERLKVYEKQTKPLISYYKRKDKEKGKDAPLLVDVDTEQPINNIFEDAESVVGL